MTDNLSAFDSKGKRASDSEPPPAHPYDTSIACFCKTFPIFGRIIPLLCFQPKLWTFLMRRDTDARAGPAGPGRLLRLPGPGSMADEGDLRANFFAGRQMRILPAAGGPSRRSVASTRRVPGANCRLRQSIRRRCWCSRQEGNEGLPGRGRSPRSLRWRPRPRR